MCRTFSRFSVYYFIPYLFLEHGSARPSSRLERSSARPVASAPSLQRPSAHSSAQRAYFAVLATSSTQNINESAQARSVVFTGFLLAEDALGGRCLGPLAVSAVQGWLQVRARAVPPSSVHASHQCSQARVRRLSLKIARPQARLGHLWSSALTPEFCVMLGKAV